MAIQPYIYDLYIYSGKRQLSQVGYRPNDERPGLATYVSAPNEEYNGIVHDNLNNLQQQNIWPFEGVSLFLKGMVVSNQADRGGRPPTQYSHMLEIFLFNGDKPVDDGEGGYVNLLGSVSGEDLRRICRYIPNRQKHVMHREIYAYRSAGDNETGKRFLGNVYNPPQDESGWKYSFLPLYKNTELSSTEVTEAITNGALVGNRNNLPRRKGIRTENDAYEVGFNPEFPNPKSGALMNIPLTTPSLILNGGQLRNNSNDLSDEESNPDVGFEPVEVFGTPDEFSTDIRGDGGYVMIVRMGGHDTSDGIGVAFSRRRSYYRVTIPKKIFYNLIANPGYAGGMAVMEWNKYDSDGVKQPRSLSRSQPVGLDLIGVNTYSNANKLISGLYLPSGGTDTGYAEPISDASLGVNNVFSSEIIDIQDYGDEEQLKGGFFPQPNSNEYDEFTTPFYKIDEYSDRTSSDNDRYPAWVLEAFQIAITGPSERGYRMWESYPNEGGSELERYGYVETTRQIAAIETKQPRTTTIRGNFNPNKTVDYLSAMGTSIPHEFITPTDDSNIYGGMTYFQNPRHEENSDELPLLAYAYDPTVPPNPYNTSLVAKATADQYCREEYDPRSSADMESGTSISTGREVEPPYWQFKDGIWTTEYDNANDDTFDYYYFDNIRCKAITGADLGYANPLTGPEMVEDFVPHVDVFAGDVNNPNTWTSFQDYYNVDTQQEEYRAASALNEVHVRVTNRTELGGTLLFPKLATSIGVTFEQPTLDGALIFASDANNPGLSTRIGESNADAFCSEVNDFGAADILRSVKRSALEEADTNTSLVYGLSNYNPFDIAREIIATATSFVWDSIVCVNTAEPSSEDEYIFSNYKYKFRILSWGDEPEQQNLNDGEIDSLLIDQYESINTNKYPYQDVYKYLTVGETSTDPPPIQTLSHRYREGGLYQIRGYVFNYIQDARRPELQQAVRWKYFISTIYVNPTDYQVEDFGALGGYDFTTLPYSNTTGLTPTPIVGGLNNNSQYNRSIDSIREDGQFTASELDELYKLKQIDQNDEFGSHVNQLDLYQVRLFKKGKFDMERLTGLSKVSTQMDYTNTSDTNKPASLTTTIHDSLDMELKATCNLELNLDQTVAGTVLDSSGQGTLGVVIGDYNLSKPSGEDIQRDDNMKLPEQGSSDNAI